MPSDILISSRVKSAPKPFFESNVLTYAYEPGAICTWMFLPKVCLEELCIYVLSNSLSFILVLGMTKLDSHIAASIRITALDMYGTRNRP